MDNSAFEIVRGDDATISVEVLDDEQQPIDLTGYTVFFTAKKSVLSPDTQAVIEKEITTGDSAGMVDINLTSEETNQLFPRSYWWDIQLEKDGVISSTKKQLFKVVSDVTRRTNENVS